MGNTLTKFKIKSSSEFSEIAAWKCGHFRVKSSGRIRKSSKVKKLGKCGLPRIPSQSDFLAAEKTACSSMKNFQIFPIIKFCLGPHSQKNYKWKHLLSSHKSPPENAPILGRNLASLLPHRQECRHRRKGGIFCISRIRAKIDFLTRDFDENLL